MLSLDEAIQYAENLGTEEENKIDYDKDSPHMIICRKNTVKDYRQLAEWLTELKELRSIIDACNILAVDVFAVEKLCKELKEAKRLLKAAVEDIVWLNEHTVDGEGQCLIETATDMETCLACPLNVNNPHVAAGNIKSKPLRLSGRTVIQMDDAIYVPKSDILDLITEEYEAGGFTDYSNYSNLWDEVDDMPAADVQPVKRGEWKHVAGMNSKCSVCSHYFPVSEFDSRPFDINFCPNCGARMDRGADDENS